MTSEQPIPLTHIRGVGPSAAVRMEECGVRSVEQLAGMSIAEFKLACPPLAKRSEAFVKGARRLLKRLQVSAEQGVGESAPPLPVADESEVNERPVVVTDRQSSAAVAQIEESMVEAAKPLKPKKNKTAEEKLSKETKGKSGKKEKPEKKKGDKKTDKKEKKEKEKKSRDKPKKSKKDKSDKSKKEKSEKKKSGKEKK